MGFARLGIDVFPRGAPEPLSVNTRVAWDAKLYDLLSAYATLRLRDIASHVTLAERSVFTLQEARERLMRMIGATPQWELLDSYLLEYLAKPELRATARASAFTASLELVREGELELKQSAPFAPLYVRRRMKEAAEPLKEAANG
jgi:segregation and condensation protein A